MNTARIAVRYAKALFDLALEKNSVNGVYRDMRNISLLCSMDEVKSVISNPVIPLRKRKDAIIALAGDGADKLTINFIELIFSNGRGEYLASAARNFMDLTRRHRGIRQVTLTTAVPVSGEMKKEMAALLDDRDPDTIEFNEQIDGSIIGGFILRVDDSYIDASVRNRLNRFRKEFSLAGYAE
ncbi:MAG: ATP synthase F1 subunit delta [Bacteroidales bacterium]|nr:ATP synthase F1 subunit delta [Bacteroidales bacterium]MCB9029126.1 ATP synthase F1 subunit delta [Bacteroidales bacterium]HOO66180.1 ATP synthase F1 subunit delta [Bacteroidales bacterium]HPE22611.1 ATP synthase F1 subunit delta [Bacteroidales bacterium]HPJ05170.1 ATP synthase F1 subunit delta [Bacteroidales bacterium]